MYIIRFCQKRIYQIIFFLVFFLLGLIIHKDYGISIDEAFHRLMGFYWLNYVLDFFPNSDLKKEVYNILINIREAHLNLDHLTPNNFIYGVFFDIPAGFIETILNIKEPKEIYFFRHFLNFLIFFISLIYFYKILSERFSEKKWAFLGTTFLILSPRIFSNSFYNPKDLIFMSLIIISLFYYFKFLKVSNFKNSFLFGLFIAIATSSKSLALIVIFIYVLFFLLSCLSKKEFFFKNIKFYIFGLGSYIIFTYISWPYLWSDPIGNLITSLKIYSDYPVKIYMLYNESYVRSDNLPWHYLFTWIGITTPVIYSILFIFGYSIIIIRFSKKFLVVDMPKKENDFWADVNEKFDLNIFILLTGVFFIVIKLDATLYTGWRHMFFIYPLIIYISILGLSNLYNNFYQYKKIILSLMIIYLISISYKMFLIHPMQNIYFNFLAGKNIHKKYEVDFWGLANIHFLNKILTVEKNSQTINIGVASWTTLERSLALLNANDRKKINVVGQEYHQADYLFNNFISEVNKKINDKYDIPKDFELYDEYYIDSIKIYEVYKKIL
tara:strand:- start:62 stop:1720 length:1659 start_codon:yes stop_codon:yes gene_type:complete